VTVTLDNNWDNKHVVSCCQFLKNVLLQKSSCFQLLLLRHLTFHKVVLRKTWGVVGSLVIVLLQIFSWYWQWNNFENRLTFDKVKAYKNGANSLGHPVSIRSIIIIIIIYLMMMMVIDLMLTGWPKELAPFLYALTLIVRLWKAVSNNAIKLIKVPYCF